MRSRCVLIKCIVVCGVLASVGMVHAQPVRPPLPQECGQLRSGYGPFDYRQTGVRGTDGKPAHEMVEGAHFTRNVEMLIRGKSGLQPGPDIAYTLRSFPNHHRALKSMADLALRGNSDTPAGMQYTATCWFQRALHFQPNDGMVRLVFGYYLMKRGQTSRAIDQFEIAKDLTVDLANLHYNLGLAYLEVRNYEKALESAHIAYSRGFPFPGLKTRLERAGHWREPAAPSTAASGPGQ